ncbi:unnamed protein product [Sympodiomycopsis kandeliae]
MTAKPDQLSRSDRESIRLVSIQDIEAAAGRIASKVIRTPLLTNAKIDSIVSDIVGVPVQLAFKAEHLQVVGAFKSRGAANAIALKLSSLQSSNPSFDSSKLCVLTHSSGNHGAALACQASKAGVRCAVVMPENAPEFKKQNVASYDAKIWYCTPTQEARESTAQEARKELESQGLTVEFIHPYDDEAIIAGQGTMGREIMQQVKQLQSRGGCSYAEGAGSDSEVNLPWGQRSGQDLPDVDFVVAPVGGGGMLSGVSSAVKGIDDRVTVIGAEPQDADDAQRSYQTGTLQPSISPPRTICDGLLTSLSERTLAHVERQVDHIALASDLTVIRSLQHIIKEMKQLIEPSAAIGLAVLLEDEKSKEMVRGYYHDQLGANGKVRIACVWSGGNATVHTLSEYLARLDT